MLNRKSRVKTVYETIDKNAESLYGFFINCNSDFHFLFTFRILMRKKWKEKSFFRYNGLSKSIENLFVKLP